MREYGLLHAVLWLGPLTRREAAAVLRVSMRHLSRLMDREAVGLDRRGRIVLGGRGHRHRACVAAVRECLDGAPVFADWLCERTGYQTRAVHEALRELGYTTRRGRGAMWALAEKAA